MNDSAVASPPFKIVASALRKTTEYLAREIVEPSASPPDWSEFEWAVARSVATMQGISVLLASRLRWRGPPAWRSFLERQREQSVLRDAAIGRLLEQLDSATCEANVGCVALKGAALRTLGIYGPGERPMADVDLLIRKADSGAAAEVLRGFQYVPTLTIERHTVYRARGEPPPRALSEHVDNPLPVEVHTLVAESLPVTNVDITQRVLPADLRPGINPYPSLVALLLHVLLHVAGNIKGHGVRQIQLHDIAALARRLGGTEWEELQRIGAEELWWAFPPLALAARYHRCDLPPGLLERLRSRCPRLLRRLGDRSDLTDVSWSNLRIDAFPGIAWSRTMGDALRYVGRRILPERAAVAAMQEELDRSPHLRLVPWTELSRGSRLMRWVLSRPPRAPTIALVTAALREGGS